MESREHRIQWLPIGALCAVAMGLYSGCGKSGSPEKVDAGQRRYCTTADASLGGKDTVSEAPASGPDLGPDIPTGADLTPSTSDLPVGVRLDVAATESGVGGSTGTVDAAGADAVAVRDAGGAGGSSGTGGAVGSGGVIGSGTADAQRDVPADGGDAPPGDSSLDRGTDGGDGAAVGGDAANDLGDGPGDLPPDQADTPPGQDTPAEGPLDLPPGPDLPPRVCRLTGYEWPKKWTPAAGAVVLSNLATAADGTPWATGNIFGPFDFGTGTPVPVPYVGTLPPQGMKADTFVAKLDPATGLATAAFSFGDAYDNVQNGLGVAVASGGNILIAGDFSGEIDFTGSNSDGTGPGPGYGVAGVDYLQNSASISYYAVIDAASSGSYATPVKAHMIDLGQGSLKGVGSNPVQNAVALCGKTSKKVSAWNTNASSMGVITGGSASAGGGMDILVAKIDASTGIPVWGKQFGGAGDQICESVTIDGNGDVIIAGGYTGTLDFGGTTTALPVVADTSLALLYVAKLSGTDGTGVAAQTWGSAGRTNAYALAADASNNVIVAGSLGGNIDFGGGISITDLGLTDAFVVKLSPALVPIWAQAFGDATYDQAAKTVGVSSAGDVYFGGSFKGSLGTLGPSASSNTAPDAFLAQLAPDGSVVCAHAYGDAAGAQQVLSLVVARAATAGVADAITVGGTFQSQITLGGTTLDTGGASVSSSFISRVTP